MFWFTENIMTSKETSKSKSLNSKGCLLVDMRRQNKNI